MSSSGLGPTPSKHRYDVRDDKPTCLRTGDGPVQDLRSQARLMGIVLRGS
jgi:hypothetical protein